MKTTLSQAFESYWYAKTDGEIISAYKALQACGGPLSCEVIDLIMRGTMRRIIDVAKRERLI